MKFELNYTQDIQNKTSIEFETLEELLDYIQNAPRGIVIIYAPHEYKGRHDWAITVDNGFPDWATPDPDEDVETNE